jgi:hypothetical protein
MSGYRPEPEELAVLEWMVGGCVMEEYVQAEGFTAPLHHFKLRSPKGVRRYVGADIQCRLLHNGLLTADRVLAPDLFGRVAMEYRVTSFGEDLVACEEAFR